MFFQSAMLFVESGLKHEQREKARNARKHFASFVCFGVHTSPRNARCSSVWNRCSAWHSASSCWWHARSKSGGDSEQVAGMETHPTDYSLAWTFPGRETMLLCGPQLFWATDHSTDQRLDRCQCALGNSPARRPMNHGARLRLHVRGAYCAPYDPDGDSHATHSISR